MIIQDLWHAKLDWDEYVPASLAQRWRDSSTQLQDISGLTIPRWISSHTAAMLQLHAFADASRRAIVAVVYSRVEDPVHGICARILLSRAKLASIKSLQPSNSRPTRMTILRLELRAALLATRLLATAAKEYSISEEHCHAWSDSQIVLYWIRSSEPTNNSLVDNYVAHIQELLPSHIWRHVPTDSNSADVASRGIDFPSLQRKRLWWESPAWLMSPPASWPIGTPNTTDLGHHPIDASDHLCGATQLNETHILDRFLDLDHLLRFFVRLRRWVRFKLQRDATLPVLAGMTATELRDAYFACVRLSQREFFSMEIESLQTGDRVAAKRPLLTLDPIIADDVLRVGGQLQHSTLCFDERHPPILEGRCPLAKLVIRWAHVQALHGGAWLTSAFVARKAWIIGGRRQIKSFFNRCLICTRLQARPATQHMAPLPAAQITPTRAFQCTGVDYAGPFNILSAKGRGFCASKGYVAVFVCMAWKAIHLELMGDLSTDLFLGALTRFCARRGRPTEIWSDNATCFRAADRKLRDAIQDAELCSDRIAGSLANQGICWRFIPPRAPHFEGLWEAGVKSMKSHLRRSIGPRNLIYEESSTVLNSIEAVLNSRPLTPLTEGPDDSDFLTPGHFLVNGSLDSVIDSSSSTQNLDRLTHWDLVRGIRAQF
ncbi:uncharacterized protein LOC106639235 [Copidosoma floridanum]|uniref:uncharacterized protein LOC106639235 n=1 Tax=Copidosoma floridanum TaxID=29053 RepID=UPI0006C93EB5|nr:uncharacterized protein LOC106639235 [Copidosoma floridanum]